MNESIFITLAKQRLLPIINPTDEMSLFKKIDELLSQQLTLIEITLRTEQASYLIEKAIETFDGLQVAVGTVVNGSQLTWVKEVGACLAISPGITHELLAHAKAIELPFLPGIQSPSDIISAVQFDYHYVKLFPAELSGGVPYLKSIQSVFPQMKFCPTGGINARNAKDYLASDAVFAVGASDLELWHKFKGI